MKTRGGTSLGSGSKSWAKHRGSHQCKLSHAQQLRKEKHESGLNDKSEALIEALACWPLLLRDLRSYNHDLKARSQLRLKKSWLVPPLKQNPLLKNAKKLPFWRQAGGSSSSRGSMPPKPTLQQVGQAECIDGKLRLVQIVWPAQVSSFTQLNKKMGSIHFFDNY